MSWGIAETASEIEKIKSKSADYLNGLNSCGVIDWNTYNYAFDFYMDLLMEAYRQGQKDTQSEQKKGKWVDTGSRQECSVCHEIQYGYDNYRHFCPNCGAKMITPNNAHWIKQPNGEYKCSVCGDTTLVPLYECHTCGAKMVTE